MVKAVIFLLLSLLLLSCGPATQAPAEIPIVTIYATSATQPWLTELYACANGQSVVLNFDAKDSDIYLRMGEPEKLVSPAYQIDKDELVVVMNDARPPILNLSQIKDIFTGKIINLNQITTEWGEAHTGNNGEIHVWAYFPDADIQKAFEKLVLNGDRITFNALLAASPQDMLKQISQDESAIGFLPRTSMGEGVFELEAVAEIPVLAIQNGDENDTTRALLSCLSR